MRFFLLSIILWLSAVWMYPFPLFSHHHRPGGTRPCLILLPCHPASWAQICNTCHCERFYQWFSDKWFFFRTSLFSSDHCTRNLCWQDWIKTHEVGTEEEFKAYWNGLSEEEIKVCLIPFFFVCPWFICIYLSCGNKQLWWRWVSLFYVLRKAQW